MEYVYAALILHEADRELSEENVTEVLEAANVDVDTSRVRALIAALEDVDIDEAIAESSFAAPAAGPAAGATAAPEAGDAAEADAEAEDAAAEEADAEEEDEDEDAGAGLGELFG